MGLRADSARPQRFSGSARTDSQRAESARNPIASHVNFGDDSALSAFTPTQWTAAFRRHVWRWTSEKDITLFLVWLQGKGSAVSETTILETHVRMCTCTWLSMSHGQRNLPYRMPIRFAFSRTFSSVDRHDPFDRHEMIDTRRARSRLAVCELLRGEFGRLTVCVLAQLPWTPPAVPSVAPSLFCTQL